MKYYELIVSLLYLQHNIAMECNLESSFYSQEGSIPWQSSNKLLQTIPLLHLYHNIKQCIYLFEDFVVIDQIHKFS